MEINLLIGGEAGQGVAKLGEILGKIFIKKGFYVFNYKDYQSLIRGGHNFNILKISDKKVFSHSWKNIDYLIALNQETVNLHQHRLKKTAKIFASPKIKAENKIEIDTQKIIQDLKAPSLMENVILAGGFLKFLGYEKEALDIFEKELNPLAKECALRGYENVKNQKTCHFPEKTSLKYFLTGNEAVALGAIAGGLDIYIAYPMTPATPVLHTLAQKQKEYNIAVLQLENEIGVITSALGASFAGAKVMVGTSGGGFALMTEACSLQGMSEIPLVLYLAQRNAPATGVPTYTGQGDLEFALNAGHGEFPRVVVAPGDAKDAFERTIEALYLAEKYRVLVILLSDKHIGESNYTFDEKDFSVRVKPQRFILKEVPKDYKNYKLTENGVSPRAVPGQTEISVRATSYEHDENGITTEEGEWVVKMNDKRWKKFEFLKKEIKNFEPLSFYGEGENLIVSWGSPKGAILDALSEIKNWSFLQINYLCPFPEKEFTEIVKNKKRIVLVENNVTGLLGRVIRERTGLEIKEKILKYDARPFAKEDILEKL